MSGPRGYGSRSSELPSFGSGGSSPRQRGSLNAPLMSTDVPRAGSGAGATGKKVGIVGSMANLANAAIGAGVLAFPLAYQEAGIVLGPLLTVAFGTILGYTLHIIASAADVARKRTGNAGSYQEIVKTLLGPTAENAIIILQVVYLTGCNVCMLMIICDQVRKTCGFCIKNDEVCIKNDEFCRSRPCCCTPQGIARWTSRSRPHTKAEPCLRTSRMRRKYRNLCKTTSRLLQRGLSAFRYLSSATWECLRGLRQSASLVSSIPWGS